MHISKYSLWALSKTVVRFVYNWLRKVQHTAYHIHADWLRFPFSARTPPHMTDINIYCHNNKNEKKRNIQIKTHKRKSQNKNERERKTETIIAQTETAVLNRWNDDVSSRQTTYICIHSADWLLFYTFPLYMDVDRQAQTKHNNEKKTHTNRIHKRLHAVDTVRAVRRRQRTIHVLSALSYLRAS